MKATIDSAEVRRVFAAYPVQSLRRLGQLIEGSAIDVQREMRIKAPVGYSGDLRRAIKYRIDPGNLSATIGPDVGYAEAVEKGTRPHWTSVKPGTSLYKWAKHKGISPYAVQRSIAKKGTKPRPFVGPTFTTVKSRVEGDIISGFSRFVEEVNRGAI